ncbi:glycine-rich domain-containing protein [Bordetella genomosp. 1]|uniref:Glycine-rich domain-containing protein-like n=1 Tax=Bordetella genomosp. 1 TaxID=1395607 RepID=A0ABX4F2P9_9BORD|nr:glycine-rich domain-containing protein-like [Bordetella genomosp. 1]OZI67962.1 hypothetical protein CAL27_00375 [Bordetella genomosp. 1]
MLTDANADRNRVITPLDFTGNVHSVPSLQESKRAIGNVDFSMLIYKICAPTPLQAIVWERGLAEQATEVYKNWLWLIRKYSETYPVLPPSVEIDEIWHHHILDTYKYAEDCKAIFGQFFHHYPYFGLRGEADLANLNSAFELTKSLYEQEFGEPLPGFLSVIE